MRRIIALILVTSIIAGTIVAILAWRREVVTSFPLSSFSESGVQVDLYVERSDQGQDVLVARYTPLREHFHVFSKDLAPDGIDGMGRPTRLDVVNGFQATGELVADQPVQIQQIEGLPEVFPVYPDGPVTLRLPIKGEGSGQITVSYMSCSSNFGCLPPTEKTLVITLPR